MVIKSFDEKEVEEFFVLVDRFKNFPVVFSSEAENRLAERNLDKSWILKNLFNKKKIVHIQKQEDKKHEKEEFGKFKVLLKYSSRYIYAVILSFKIVNSILVVTVFKTSKNNIIKNVVKLKINMAEYIKNFSGENF